MADFSSNDDVIDVRDIIARFEELRDERDGLQADADEEGAEIENSEAELPAPAYAKLTAWKDENGEEFDTLRDLLDEMKGNGGDEQWEGDWYPATLIRDSHFNDAMDELLEDIGDLPKNLPCYLTITVDYDALQMDYTSVEYDGVTYWYR
jgi:hypothetical protein